jgi:glycosyltransferase involved in cell wall biosynthesis
MKIALIGQPFDIIMPPSQNSIGLWVFETSQRLAKQNQVFVYGRRSKNPKKTISENVMTRQVFSLPNPWLTKLSNRVSRIGNPKKPLFSRFIFYLEYILPIAMDLRRKQIDLVHLQNYSQFVPVIRALNPNIKIALHMRCDWLTLMDYDLIDSRLHKTDLILGVSNSITDEIRDRFPHHSPKCFTAYTGVDTEMFKPLDTTENHDGKPRRILFVGRVTPEKGVHLLLQAVKEIAPQFPDLQVDIVGSISSLPRDRMVGMTEDQQIRDLDIFYNGESYLSRLESILPDDLKDRVHFLRHVHYRKTLDYYRNAAFLVNPAYAEPFGRSLIEANACGVPIIASRTGGMVELIQHGKNGFFVEPGNVDELTQAIRILLENGSMRQQMGSEGRKFVVDRFSWDRVTSDLLSIYQHAFESVPA